MYVLDTDTLTHLLLGHKRTMERRAQITEEVAITLVTRIEVLRGRFASVFTAENGEKLLQAQRRLTTTETDLDSFVALTIGAAACTVFDGLRQNKKIKIGRTDLLIAAITLANGATLVTRNQKDFRKVPNLQLENWVD